MLNTASLQKVHSAKLPRNFVKPCYDSYCFSYLPATIEFLLTGTKQSALPLDVFGDLPTRYDKVILFFIDAFGWRFFERYADKHSFLQTVLAQGTVSKMTAQFPSTTAAHVTCIHTGLPVAQSGVYEWNYYEPLLDEVISPLLFSLAGDKYARDTIKRMTDLPPEMFFPRKTFYHTLQAQGITSHVLQYQAYASSTYSQVVFRGATIHPYQHLSEAFSRLADLVLQPAPTPAYYFLYYDRIDAVCHNYGLRSKQLDQAIDHCFTAIDQLFYQRVHGKASRTLLMITADHGQVEVNPRTTYYLNRQIPGIARSLKTNRRGHPIVPAGSPRDMFLHVKEDHIDEVVIELRQRLVGKADVYRTQDLLDQHFFGKDRPAPALLGRLGNVVILPYKYETVWWYEEGKFDMHFQGHHGGLTSDEMEIPLILFPLCYS